MAEEMSKSAKKRAAKKARDEAATGEAAPAVAAPKAEPKAKAKAKAKASGEPFCSSCGAQFSPGANFCNNCGAKRPTPAAAPAAETKVAAKAEPKKAAEKPKAEPKPAAAKAQPKAKAQAAPKEEDDEPVRKAPEAMSYSFDDDGTGGDWEKATGLSKKAAKQKAAKDQREAEAKSMGFANSQQAIKQLAKAAHIPGFNPVADAKGTPAANQGMAAGPGLVAKIQAEAAARAAAGQAVETTEVKSSANLSTVQIPCPPEKIGRIVGPKGATLEMLKQKCGVDRVDTADGMVTLVGEPDAVKKAEVAVKEMIEKGFMSIQFDNFGEQTVMVHPSNFADIIGSKGAIIMQLKKELKVEINIPQGVQKDSKGQCGKKKYPVGIAGAADNVEKAKEVINDIVYYKHHPITHPDIIHHELEIEEWTWKFIIGPKGSEMRHIQNSFKVTVNIPRDNYWETGANPNVLIVGLPHDVEKAKKHIEKVIYNAEHNQGGRGREDAAMGDERDGNDDIDAVAAQYLYKRK